MKHTGRAQGVNRAKGRAMGTLKGLEIRKNGKTYDTITDYWKRLSEKV